MPCVKLTVDDTFLFTLMIAAVVAVVSLLTQANRAKKEVKEFPGTLFGEKVNGMIHLSKTSINKTCSPWPLELDGNFQTLSPYVTGEFPLYSFLLHFERYFKRWPKLMLISTSGTLPKYRANQLLFDAFVTCIVMRSNAPSSGICQVTLPKIPVKSDKRRTE